MKSPLISIIVPVYNVEKYLEKCMMSVLQQDIPAEMYEVIVVNDGSADNSVWIVESYMQTHANLILINQENRGLSGARNTGLKASKGLYIWFVDSDDWIAPNCLKTITEKLIADALDILLLKLVVIDENNQVTYRKELPNVGNRGVVKGVELYAHLELSWNVVRYVFKRDMLIQNQLYFKDGILFEDGIFLDKVFYYSERSGIYNEIVYYYYQRSDSIVNSTKNIEKKQHSFFVLAQEAIAFFDVIDNVVYKKTLKTKIVSYICQYLNYQSITHSRNFSENLKKILPLKYEDEHFASRIRIFLINHCPSVYGWLMMKRDQMKNKSK